jgi:outer membrane protein assembly factor BamD (BamD/ComL family)
MLKRSAPLLLAAVFCLGGAGCKDTKTQAELMAEKKKDFRTKQKQVAIKAYKDLVDKYPESEFAPKAQEKLQQLGPLTATPAPKKK